MKKFWVLISVIIVLFSLYLVKERFVVFSYINPYTETQGYKYIAPVTKELQKGFDYSKKYAKSIDDPIDYLFFNVYGSGFVKNNSIPNDLDVSVGIDLGEFDYNEENKDELASKVVKKMQDFDYSFNFYINTLDKRSLYTTASIFDSYDSLKFNKYGYQNCIKKHLDDAISGKEYIYYAHKIWEDANMEVDLPYMMHSHELLIEDCNPILMFSDMVLYNTKSPKYMREVSLIPEFFFTVNKNGKKVRIELVPESYLGSRLQLSRRFFASNSFVGSASKYINSFDFLNDDEKKYFFYRMYSFRRHMQEYEIITEMQFKPVKLLKRLMQTADIVHPLIGDEKYNEISEFVLKNLSDPELQLLNEYENICKLFNSITEHEKVYSELLRDGHIARMYKVLGETMNSIEANSNIDAKTKKILREYYEQDLIKILHPEELDNIQKYKDTILHDKFGEIQTSSLTPAIYNEITPSQKSEEYLKLFQSIFTEAGYHRVIFSLMQSGCAGVVEDDFTKNIKDLKTFAKDNDLADLNYKLIKKSDIKSVQMAYEVWVRYNPTAKEQEAYEKLRKILLDDKKNFYERKKYILF